MRISLGVLIVLAVWQASCIDSKDQKNQKVSLISESDYSSYPEYWFDKTVDEVGAAIASPLETEHDFEILPPDVKGSHRFQIKNNGDHPLHLLTGPRSCKCTAVKLIDRVIAPQETGEIELVWTTVEFAEKFNHTGSVYTNDPNLRQIKFRITGKVSREVAYQPGGFFFDRVVPDSLNNFRDVLFFSEEWESLDIEEIESTLDEKARFEVLPADASHRARRHFRSAKVLRMHLENGLERGRFRGSVGFTLVGTEANGKKKRVPHRVEIRGKVTARFSLESVSPNLLSADGILEFGRVESEVGKTELFLMTVNDSRQKKISIKKVTANPDVLTVSMEPLNNRVEKHGVYRMKISIPNGLPPALYNRDTDFGTLKIEFDHPRVQPIELKLDFYIL